MKIIFCIGIVLLILYLIFKDKKKDESDEDREKTKDSRVKTGAIVFIIVAFIVGSCARNCIISMNKTINGNTDYEIFDKAFGEWQERDRQIDCPNKRRL